MSISSDLLSYKLLAALNFSAKVSLNILTVTLFIYMYNVSLFL